MSEGLTVLQQGQPQLQGLLRLRLKLKACVVRKLTMSFSLKLSVAIAQN